MEESKEKPFQVSCTVSASIVSDFLARAFGGGSNYWYWLESTTKAQFVTLSSDMLGELPTTEIGFVIVMAPKNSRAGDLKSKFKESDHEMLPALLDRKAVARGLQVMFEMFPQHLVDMLGDNGDSNTGDVLLQFCLYGDIVFG